MTFGVEEYALNGLSIGELGLWMLIAGYFNVPVFHPAAALRAPSTLDLLRDDFANLKSYLAEEESPPEPPTPEPEQMGLF